MTYIIVSKDKLQKITVYDISKRRVREANIGISRLDRQQVIPYERLIFYLSVKTICSKRFGAWIKITFQIKTVLFTTENFM